MRAFRSAVVSSALLFILGAGGMHPVSGTTASSDAQSDGLLTSLVIAEFYPCAANGDEYLVLSNRGSETVNLCGWSVTDGEGTVAFTAGSLPPGQRLSVSENASSYASAYGEPPDVHVVGWSTGDGVDVSGRFRMADAGDCLQLVSPDDLPVDAVAYGEASLPSLGWSGPPVPALRTGEVAKRSVSDIAADTDTAMDWMHFREFRYGYSDHTVVSSEISPGKLMFFTSPDCSLDVIAGALYGAASSIRICSYEFSSASVCKHLMDAASRGIEVSVLVDSDPVGGMSADQIGCLSCLALSGADVRVLGGNMDRGIVRHVGALHAKYIVVDDSTLVALSENFVEGGVPVDRLFGNRGWGVSVTDDVVAPFMSSVFDDDSRLDRPDVWLWREDTRYDSGAVPPVELQSAHREGMLVPCVNFEGAVARVYVSPDVSSEEPFLRSLISGSREVRMEQFQAELAWTTRWSSDPVVSPLVDALDQVLRSGGSVRGLFDGSWYNVASNTEVMEYLSAAALASGSELSFALLPEGSPVTTMHNKGLVLGASSVVSSNNWVYASFARNRELAVVVESQEASSYFSRAFMFDWVPDTQPPAADAGEDVRVENPCVVVLDASGSWDDRAIAEVSWDLDGDGSPEADGPWVEFLVEVPGTHELWVEVTDAWGNSARDSVVVTMDASSEPGDAWTGIRLDVPWPLPAALSLIVAVLATARKLNLLRAITRGKG